jgi:hypothetical protein
MASKLSLVTGARPGTKPPRKLGRCGSDLWLNVMREYQINDVGGLQLLCAACEALDLAQVLRARIDADGPVIQTNSGMREHPCLRSELANRAFAMRALERLGITVEPVKPIGRPPTTIGWSGEAEE